MEEKIYYLSFERSKLDGKYALIGCVYCYAGMCACRLQTVWDISYSSLCMEY